VDLRDYNNLEFKELEGVVQKARVHTEKIYKSGEMFVFHYFTFLSFFFCPVYVWLFN